jgi:thioredoxin
MTPEAFEQLKSQTKLPLLVEFWAPWCGPCKMMNPILSKTAEIYQGNVELVKVNADESPELLRQLGVLGIPLIIGIQNGQEKFRKTGAMGTNELDQVFSAMAQGRTPKKELAPFERSLRGGSGLVLAILALSSGPSWLLLGVAGLLMFSAVYDRCPIYQAIVPRLKTFITGR